MSEPARELRDRAAAEAWLAGGLCLMRLLPPGADEYMRVAPWLMGVLTEAGAMPPAGVIADIGHLLGGGSLRTLQPLPALLPGLGSAVHAYEDHVLGRLEADPRLDAVIDAVARLPAQHRDHAVALFVTHVWHRMGGHAGVSVSPGVARRVIHMPVDELCGTGHAALTGGDIAAMLEEGYQALISGARRLGTLISEAEVFLMENFDALGDLTQRIAIEQMIEVADALSASLPRRLKPRARRERERIPTLLAAEDNYPTGGFSSLATSGSLENLVSSELIYMEELQPDSAAHIDLFDLRYAEGELLYYTRDESVFVRGQRVVTFALMPDLEAVRFKDPALPWQRLVMALGLMIACLRRLGDWLSREGLLFRVVFVRGSAMREPLVAERGLCALALREFMARGMAEVAHAPDLDAVVEQCQDSARRARTSLIVLSTARQELEFVPGILMGAMCLGDTEPALTWAGSAEPAHSQAEKTDPWPAWTAMTLELLQELV
jgi:hypothetical protein